jgi:hypothetical protein
VAASKSDSDDVLYKDIKEDLHCVCVRRGGWYECGMLLDVL